MSSAPPREDLPDPHEWVLQELLQALQFALAFLPSDALPPDLHLDEFGSSRVDGFRLVLNHSALANASRAARSALLSSPDECDALTDILRAVATAPLVAVEHPDGPTAASRLQHRLVLGTAFIFAKRVAAEYDLRLRLGGRRAQELTAAMSGGRRASVRAVVRRLLEPRPATPWTQPRALVLAPLTHVAATDHPAVIRDAQVAMSSLQAVAYDVEGPDVSLAPTASYDTDPLTRHEQERAAVLAADLVVVVGAEHDSWGASRCVTWAEANATPVLLLSRDNTPVTRILSGSPHRTSQQSYSSEQELYAKAQRWAAKQLDTASDHQQRRLTLQKLAGPLAALDIHDDGDKGLLPNSRIRSALASPASTANMSIMELLCLPADVRGKVVAAVAALALPNLDINGTEAVPEQAPNDLGAPHEPAAVEPSGEGDGSGASDRRGTAGEAAQN